MAQANKKPLAHLLQLPKDLLVSIVELCGPKEKWALFMTCHSARGLVLEAAHQISGSLHLHQLPVEPRPPLLLRDLDGCWLKSVQLQLKDVSLSSLLVYGDSLRGIKHLKLAMFKDNQFVLVSSESSMQLQSWAPDSAGRLQTALSQLRSLSITLCDNQDVPGLLCTLATSCTQLTHLELSPTPWSSNSQGADEMRGVVRALRQLSSVHAFPALQSLSIGAARLGSKKDPNHPNVMGQNNLQAMMALQALPAVQAAQAVQAAEATRAVELLTNHPTAQSRVTRLTMPLLVPANAAVQLGNLRELHVQGHVSVGQVQALQCLSCLTSLTARGLTSKLQDPVLQPSDLPPRLQAFRVQGLRLYALDKWMPALVTVPHLEVGSVITQASSNYPRQSEQRASKGAAAALMHGRRLAGVESGLCRYQWGSQETEPPVTLNGPRYGTQLWPLGVEAMQPLLSQLPFVEVVVSNSELNNLKAVAGSLAATTTKLRLKLCMFKEPAHSFSLRHLRTAAGWLELLDALPRVKTVQITLSNNDDPRQGAFPVYREDGMCTSLEPAVERVMDCAISACEQKGRILELCGPKGWLTFEEYQGLLNRSHVIRVAEIYKDDHDSGFTA